MIEGRSFYVLKFFIYIILLVQMFIQASSRAFPLSICHTFEMMFSYSYISRMLYPAYYCRKYTKNLCCWGKNPFTLLKKSSSTVLVLYLLHLCNAVDWIFRPLVNFLHAKWVFGYFVAIYKSFFLRCELCKAKTLKKL